MKQVYFLCKIISGHTVNLILPSKLKKFIKELKTFYLVSTWLLCATKQNTHGKLHLNLFLLCAERRKASVIIKHVPISPFLISFKTSPFWTQLSQNECEQGDIFSDSAVFLHDIHNVS